MYDDTNTETDTAQERLVQETLVQLAAVRIAERVLPGALLLGEHELLELRVPANTPARRR